MEAMNEYKAVRQAAEKARTQLSTLKEMVRDKIEAEKANRRTEQASPEKKVQQSR